MSTTRVAGESQDDCGRHRTVGSGAPTVQHTGDHDAVACVQFHLAVLEHQGHLTAEHAVVVEGVAPMQVGVGPGRPFHDEPTAPYLGHTDVRRLALRVQRLWY